MLDECIAHTSKAEEKYNENNKMLEIIKEIQTLSEAIKFCIRLSGLTHKQVYLELGLDPAQWSRIINNNGAHFPTDKLLNLMQICGNKIPLQWLAYKVEWDMNDREKSADELIASIQRQLHNSRRLNEIQAEEITILRSEIEDLKSKVNFRKFQKIPRKSRKQKNEKK